MGSYPATVSKILNGERNPGPDFCRALARALNYPQEFVFRKAGLLDDDSPPEDNLTRLLNHYFAQLSPQEQQIILTQIESLAQKHERTTAAGRVKPSRASS